VTRGVWQVRILRRRLPAWRCTLTLAGLIAAQALAAPSPSQAAIVTYHGNSQRTGLYTGMHRLTPALVASPAFGRLFDRTLPDDGQIYAQPLLAGGRLIVATEQNDVYELDPRTGRILLSRFLVAPWRPIMTTISGPFTCPDLYPDVGVTSTPVIDTSADGGRGVIYVTAKTTAPPGQASLFNQGQYLMYALSLSDLSNVPSFNGGQPLVLGGSVAGTNPLVAFNATFQLQRPALLETDGEIFAGFGGLCDTSPYRGWVIGVRAADGTIAGSWATPTAPGARGAGIWMSGGGLATDQPGRIFLATGNGFNAPGFNSEHTPMSPAPGSRPPSGLGSSIVQLTVGPGGTLSVGDFFTPCNARLLDGGPNLDLDVSSGGVLALPASLGSSEHRRLLLAGGKSGTLYLLDRNAMGGFDQGRATRSCPKGGDADAGILGAHGAVWGDAAVWPDAGGWIFVPTLSPGGANDATRGPLDFYHGHLGTFRLVGATASVWGPGSGSPIVTAVGVRSDTALVWAVSKGVGAPKLRVYRAVLRGRQPSQLASFPVGSFAKFAPPGVGADEIFVGGAGSVVAYGVKSRHR
jgi:hypothetical protein